ncbi:hypothetical protein CK203_002731 [Vitis vinifera]|uniref:Uncharacterized protein n=1 Tax=Vitis vinifera TaxID=29760 RepID=A0A438KGW8_VITVI|nr:hypothetical protein CK203_002731 [Vitis vinifera]
MQTSPRNEGLIFPVLAAALLSWSLISLVDLIVFLLIQFTRPKTGKQLCANLYLLISSVCYQCFLMLGAWHVLARWVRPRTTCGPFPLQACGPGIHAAVSVGNLGAVDNPASIQHEALGAPLATAPHAQAGVARNSPL